MKTLFAILLTFGCLGAYAQSTGGVGAGQQQRQGGYNHQKPKNGPSVPARMGRDLSVLGLLSSEDVQQDLAFDDATLTKLKTVIAKYQKDLNDTIEGLRKSGAPFDTARPKLAAVSAQYEGEAKALLSPKQVNRLMGIRIQLVGKPILLETDVQEKLELTKDQTTKIKGFYDKMETELKAARAEKDPTKRRQVSLPEIRNRWEDKYSTVLTQKQVNLLDNLRGKPFVASEQKGIKPKNQNKTGSKSGSKSTGTTSGKGG